MAMLTQPSDELNERFVLVVDDDSRVRESLTGLLGSAGIRVLCFCSAEALIDSRALAKSSCLITDVRMPEIDGWELQKRVARTHPHVFIIFISAFQDQQAFQRAFALGAFAFLYKPFDGEELLRTVEAALSQSAGS
jgi:FixJ family two-component response regulator